MFEKGLKLVEPSQSELIRLRVAIVRASTASGVDLHAGALRKKITNIRQAQRSRVGFMEWLASEIKQI